MQMILLKTLTTKTLFLKSLSSLFKTIMLIIILDDRILCEIKKSTNFGIMIRNFKELQNIISFHSSSDESCDEDEDGELLPKDEGKISAKIFYNRILS